MKKLVIKRHLVTGVCTLLFVWACAIPASAQTLPLTINKIFDLDFGICEELPGTTFVVDAAASPGASACPTATAARFDLTGDANARIGITYTKNVTITNGSDSITVRTALAPTGGNIRLDASGNLSIYIGGQFKVPQAGLISYTPFTYNHILTVVYK